MEEQRGGRAGVVREEEVDVSEICPSCGRRGERQKCKVICTNPRCGTHIILACVD